MNDLLYRLKARICEHFEWFNKDFDPEADPHYLYEAVSGVDKSGEYPVYWLEQYVVGRGLFRNWWYSFRWDTSN